MWFQCVSLAFFVCWNVISTMRYAKGENKFWLRHLELCGLQVAMRVRQGHQGGAPMAGSQWPGDTRETAAEEIRCLPPCGTLHYLRVWPVRAFPNAILYLQPKLWVKNNLFFARTQPRVFHDGNSLLSAAFLKTGHPTPRRRVGSTAHVWMTWMIAQTWRGWLHTPDMHACFSLGLPGKTFPSQSSPSLETQAWNWWPCLMMTMQTITDTYDDQAGCTHHVPALF